MKTISLLRLRNHLGEVIDTVRIEQQEFVVLKHERPVAKITPFPSSRKRRSDLKLYKKWAKKLMARFPDYHPSPDLLSLVGGGDRVTLEEERETLEIALQEKYF